MNAVDRIVARRFSYAASSVLPPGVQRHAERSNDRPDKVDGTSALARNVLFRLGLR
jgi:hypothetical protein